MNGIPNPIDGLLSSDENSRYTDYMNSLNINYKNLKFNFSHEIYDKAIYYPYYYEDYPNHKGEVITTATPTRYDFSISLDKSIRNHRFLFAIQHANETYQSYDVLDSQGVDTLTSSIFQSNQKKNVNSSTVKKA